MMQSSFCDLNALIKQKELKQDLTREPAEATILARLGGVTQVPDPSTFVANEIHRHAVACDTLIYRVYLTANS